MTTTAFPLRLRIERGVILFAVVVGVCVQHMLGILSDQAGLRETSIDSPLSEQQIWEHFVPDRLGIHGAYETPTDEGKRYGS